MSSETHVLCIETSASCCSVGLATKMGECLALAECCAPQAHARLLPLLCEDVLAQAALRKQDLRAVAVSVGPGSFTGLRIGAATAKGLCYGLSLPLIACPSLQVMASFHASYVLEDSLLLPLVPQKGNTYAYALYDKAGSERLAPQMGRFELDSILSHITKSTSALYVLGRSEEVPLLLQKSLPAHVNLHVVPMYPSAMYMVDYAFCAYQSEQFVALADFSPYYPAGRWERAD